MARSNHSNACCFSEKLCNSPRLINHINSDEQSLDFGFSGSIRILCLCLVHECEGWAPFQLREHQDYEASQTLILLRPIESCKLGSQCEAAVQSSLLSMTAGLMLQFGVWLQGRSASSDAPGCPLLCNWLCEVKEQLPLWPACGTCQLWLGTLCRKFPFLSVSA